MINKKVKAFLAVFLSGCLLIFLIGWFFTGTPYGKEWGEGGMMGAIIGLVIVVVAAGATADSTND